MTVLSVEGAVVILPSVAPYRFLQNSPWNVAVSAGDALKFGDQFCNFPAGTLPDGLGVHDDFEDSDCLSPWLKIVGANVGHGASVDADDGLPLTPGGTSVTQVFNQTAQRFEARLQFLITSDGKYPQWLGFAVTATGPAPPAQMMDLLGVSDQIFATINLTDLLGNYRDPLIVGDDVFVGFIADQPVKEVLFHDGGLVLDHFQYGYGAAPVPEPAVVGMGLAGALICLRRRR